MQACKECQYLEVKTLDGEGKAVEFSVEQPKRNNFLDENGGVY